MNRGQRGGAFAPQAARLAPLLLVGAALLLSGCGRKGPLTLPPEKPATQETQQPAPRAP